MPGSPDLMEGWAALDAHADQYAQRWLYYAGELPERFASKRLRALIDGTAKDYRFRLARIPVSTLANRLRINSITSSRGDSVNKVIEEIRQANDMDLQEPFIHERVLVYGDAYLFVWPIQPEEMEETDRPADADSVAAGVEFAFQSPLSARSMYDNEDGRRMRFFIRRWKEESAIGNRWRAEVWYWDRVEHWITTPGANGSDPAEWMPFAEDEFGESIPVTPDNWPEPHDFGEIPFKHARTDMPYGRGEADDFVGPQNMVTKAISTQATGIESHGWPERYRIADDKALLDQAGDIVPWNDSVDAPARVAGDQPLSGRQVGAGTEHTYHGTKAVGQFASPDIGALEEPLDQWIRLGAAASETPYSAFDPRFGANMSGVAWDRSERPLREKEEDRKRFLLRFWREVYGLALLFRGMRDSGDITINWAPPAVISDPEWWQTATVRRDHGVPQKTILMEANYLPEDIETWEEEQDEALFADERIDRLARMGDALQKLGAGATLLGIPPERVATMVEVILGDMGSPGKLTLEEKEVPPQLEQREGEDDAKDGSPPSGSDDLATDDR